MAFVNWRLRFSLRSLFVITTLVAACTYLWLVLPTLTAHSFVAAVERKNFSAADHLFIDAKDRFLKGMAEKNDRFEVVARLESPEKKGKRENSRLISVELTFGTWNHVKNLRSEIVAGRSGVEKPVYEWIASGYTIANHSR